MATAAYPPSSRYYGIEVAKVEVTGGEAQAYLRRRFVPAPESFFLLQEHSVTEGERPDNIAHKYLGDPEQFWRLCDANNVMDPNELTGTPGQKICITLPAGISG